MTRRPPVVAIMGHIDHGKSTLLDYIRKSNVTAKEAGGITQHISAYEIRHKSNDGREEKITFLDTPGHEAFRGIRTRGASIADIAVLIVSAEDGVKPQTLEAYEKINESNMPFIVGITKIDKPSANIEFTKQSLAENDIYVEGYGGNVPVVAFSAKTGAGVDELLDLILLQAELENFTGEEEAAGEGYILESRLDAKKGITAVGIIKNGTLRRGMFAATSGAMSPMRFILDEAGNNVEDLTFSSPIQIIGWDKVPSVGEKFKTFLKKDEAMEYASSVIGIKDIGTSATGEGVTNLNIILKADTMGSLEAINYEISKLKKERILPRVVSSGIGSVNEGDIKTAIASPGTVVFAFHTKIDSQADALAERSGIPVNSYNIIYELTKKIDELLTEREPRIEVEEVLGSAKVLKIFSINKDKQVIGARVQSGEFSKNAQVKIVRRESEIGRGRVRELQQAKIAVDSIQEGNEFGTLIESKIEIAPGDILEAVILVTK